MCSMPPPPPFLAVISDTHGLLRPEALAQLRGCAQIIHAGDVGHPEVLFRLRQIAPVTVVRGNVDKGAWAEDLPATAVLEWNGISIYVLHIVEELDLDPRAAGMGVVIYGHSHKPEAIDRDGILYLNPGSAGPKRFSLPITLAHLTMEAGRPQARFVPLGV
jgi:putative phosphoesterase